MIKGVCRFNQTGFWKFQSECQGYHENEMCKDDSCSRKEMPSKAHKFGEGCS